MSAFIYVRRTFSSERENMELLDLRFSEKTLKILKGMAGQVLKIPMRSVYFPSCISPARRYLCRRKMLYNDAGNDGQGDRRKKDGCFGMGLP